jgi:hypothetical protein
MNNIFKKRHTFLIIFIEYRIQDIKFSLTQLCKIVNSEFHEDI